MTEILIPQFIGSISYWGAAVQANKMIFSPQFPFRKSSRINRTEILTANGIQVLTVPVTGGRNIRGALKDIKISYDTPWQKIHLQALQSAYGKSAFWEFYVDHFTSLYQSKNVFLLDLNLQGFEMVQNKLKLKLELEVSLEEEFNEKQLNNLYRSDKALPSYFQTFSHKFPFTSDLSIIDLMMNIGPKSGDYLLGLKTID